MITFLNKQNTVKEIINSENLALIKVNASKKFIPGQFFEVSIKGKGSTPISVSSNSKYLELIFPKNCDFRKTLSQCKPGDIIDLTGPHGNGYPITDFFDKNLVLIAEGYGVSSIKSIIEYVDFARLKFKEVKIILSGCLKNSLFADDIKKWETNYHLSFFELDKELDLNIDWDINQRVLVLSGSSKWVDSVVEQIKDKFLEENIWLNYECKMQCTDGECKECAIGSKYVCRDGPIFSYKEINKEKK